MVFPRHHKFVISISYGDCFVSGGGTDKAQLSQIRIMMGNDYSVFSISPYILSKRHKNNSYWTIRLDGRVFAVWKMKKLLSYLLSLPEEYGLGGVQIHHFCGIKIPDIKMLIDNVMSPVFFYLHDFYTICPNGYGNLLRVDKSVCDFTREDCQKCPLFNPFFNQIESFFAEYSSRIHIIAPSDCCGRIWARKFIGLEKRVISIYHQTFEGQYMRRPTPNGTIRIAFLGAQNDIKGWDDFVRIVSAIGNEETRYSFFYFGSGREIIPNVQNVFASFHKNGASSMVDLLREYGIDVVMLLSKWPETYSYTYYESYASGCLVLTYEISGNIASQVVARKNGRVFRDTQEIIDYLSDGQLLQNDISAFFALHSKFPLNLDENDEFLNLFTFGGSWKNVKNGFHKRPVCRFGLRFFLYQTKLFLKNRR